MPKSIAVDLSALEELRQELDRLKPVALGRLGERGYQLLRDEIKKSAYVTGNLQQGVAPPDVKKDYVLLTVSARSARRGARTATLHLKSGKTKSVKLRATPGFNYAERVARGRPAIRAKSAKALLIPVDSPPSGESYIESEGRFYIVRKQAKATKPNPYDERAARRLEVEAVSIVDAVIGEIF